MFNRWQYNKILLVSLGIGLLYLLLSMGWILYSDRLAIKLASSRQELEMIQQYKGLGFVALMSLLITWLVYRIQRHGFLLKRTLHNIHTDVVTGLSNRIVAEKYMDKYLETIDRQNKSCGIILINIRGLSRINRSVGRSGGDYVLFKVARRIRRICRPNDLIARLESNRLLIILGILDDEEKAADLARKILEAFNRPIRIGKVDVQVDLQCVLAIAPKDGRTTPELLDAGERALYRVKKSNREANLVLVNEDDLKNDSKNLELEAELRRAIRDRQLTIVLQPQIRLDTFEVEGAEALVRWNSRKFGNISPAEFIPMAESLGLVQEITKQVLDNVGSCLAGWMKNDLAHINVSVNLSSLDLRNGQILEVVESFLDRYHIPGRLITMEITETWLMEDPNIALGLIYRLRETGPRFAIDDFGTGYSALSQLIDFPFDCVKFDRSFVSGINHSPKKAKVLTAIQRLSATLGAETVAEGVETMDELALIEQIGIHGAQGFLFAKPVTPDDFETRYLKPARPPFEDVREKLEILKKKNPDSAVRIGRAV